MQCSPVGVYQPRQPRLTPFFQVIEDYAEEFARVYDDAFEAEYGPWRPHVRKVFERYLACGDLHHGFARVHCDACAHDFLLAFSCKTRCLCLSCHQKRALLFGERLDREVLAEVPHRQYVFTIPKLLRGLFRREPRLLGLLPAAAWRATRELFGAAFEDGVPGAVMALQTYGDRAANWHPHLHGMVSEGVFARDGRFHPLPMDHDLERLTDLFRHHLLRALLDAERLTQATVERLLTWRHHSGFQVHRGGVLWPDDSAGRQRVARYLVHPPVALDRLQYDAEQALITYTSDRRGQVETLHPLDWLARLASHIPNQGVHLVRYLGHYSNRAKGARARSASPHPEAPPMATLAPAEPASPPRTSRATRQSWARLLMAIWQADPLLCPRCGQTMRVLGAIHRPDVIRRILRHLRLWDVPSRAPPHRRPMREDPAASDPWLDAWPEADPDPGWDAYTRDL